MATQLFFRNERASTHRGTNSANLAGSTSLGWSARALALTRGGSLVAATQNTVTGPTLGVECGSVGAYWLEWLSEPVSADATISGTITANIWCAESSMSANVAINVVIDIVRANSFGADGSNTIVNIVKSTRTTEEALTTRAAANFTTGMTSGGYTGQTLNRGDRLRIRIFGDDSAAANMATGFTFSVGLAGPTAAADGDSYVTFTENLTFESAPAGTQLFLTNVQSGLSGAPALISDFTGADENPLSEGGNWANLNSSSNPMKRISNAAAGSVGAAQNASYWTPGNFGPDLDAYVTLSTATASLAGIAARIQGEGGAATWDGYAVLLSTASASIRRFDNGVATILVQPTSPGAAAGDKLGIRCEGSTIQFWFQDVSVSSNWNLLATAVDATYGSAGKIALLATDTTARLDDFYAATDSNLFTQQAWTSRGAGVVSYISDTDAGWVSPLLTNDWYTKQLTAFTLTGLAQLNIRALESNASAAASMRGEIARVDSDGTNATVWASWCLAPASTDDGELGTSETARTINVSGDDLAISNGQRLRLRLYLDDMATEPMADAFNVQTFYNGTSAAASGDSYLTLAQSVTEFSAAALIHEPLRAMQAVNRSNVY